MKKELDTVIFITPEGETITIKIKNPSPKDLEILRLHRDTIINRIVELTRGNRKMRKIYESEIDKCLNKHSSRGLH